MGSGSTLNSFGSKLLQLNGSGRESVVRMAHYKGTIVVVKLLSKKGVTFTHVDELEMTAVSFVKAKFHYASWFGAGSELASVMEFGFCLSYCTFTITC